MRTHVLNVYNPWTHVIISQQRRAKFYKKGDKIPRKYQTKDYTYGVDGFLVHKVTKTKPIKNSRSAGTPRTWKINGQDLINGNVHNRLRAKIFKEVKEYLVGILSLQTSSITFPLSYPLCISIIFSDVIEQGNWDLDNKALIWTKWIQDSLVEAKIIDEDNIKHIQEINIKYKEVDASNRNIEIKLIELDD